MFNATTFATLFYIEHHFFTLFLIGVEEKEVAAKKTGGKGRK
jgi:hypothetical protein